MGKEANKAPIETAVYKPGCRREDKKRNTTSKLKYGRLGIDAIVKPNN